MGGDGVTTQTHGGQGQQNFFRLKMFGKKPTYSHF